LQARVDKDTWELAVKAIAERELHVSETPNSKFILKPGVLTLSLPRVPKMRIQDKSQMSFGKYLNINSAM